MRKKMLKNASFLVIVAVFLSFAHSKSCHV